RTLSDLAAVAERHDVAQAAAQHLVDLAPDDASALVRAARVALTAHKQDDAARLAMQAIDLSPKDADAHGVLALVALARHDADGARSEALEGRRSEPESLLPLFVNARLLVDEGNDTEALATLEKANAGAAKGKAAPIQDLKALTADVLVRSDRVAEAE